MVSMSHKSRDAVDVIELSLSVYIASRFLFFLARRQHAPRFCGQLYSNSGKTTVVPWVGVLVAACFALLAFMSASSAEEVRSSLLSCWQPTIP